MAALTVVIPALNAAAHLPACLAALSPAGTKIVVDGGSDDATVAVAEQHGCSVLRGSRGRGQQLRAGAHLARTEWLLFLHADTVLDERWYEEAARFMNDPSKQSVAAVFRFALDDTSPAAQRLERWVQWRTRCLGLPYGDQGLLIHRALYDSVGGFQPLPLMEDVDIIRRIGPRRLVQFQARAVTSAVRWRQEGWLWRSARNLFCLTLYFLGVPPRLIVKVYGR